MTDHPHALRISKVIAATPAQIWAAWSSPETMARWFAPEPVRTEVLKFEFRPGGAFHLKLTGPDGTVYSDEEGCFLDIVPLRQIVFTDALSGGYRPTGGGFMTAIIRLEPAEGGGTRYTAEVLHKDEADMRRHAEMGFESGWGTVIDQLDRVAREG